MIIPWSAWIGVPLTITVQPWERGCVAGSAEVLTGLLETKTARVNGHAHAAQAA